MQTVLIISLIGAGLVLLCLAVLWLLMAILVQATGQKAPDEMDEADAPLLPCEPDVRLKIAAISGAVAIALRKTESNHFKGKAGLHQSAWQITHRYQQLHNQPDINRKRDSKC